MNISVTKAKNLLFLSWKEFSDDQATRLGASLAFYTMLSLAPLLILLIALAGLVFGREAAQGQLFDEIRNMVGADGAAAIQSMIAGAQKPATGIVASVMGFLTLIFGASSVAGELKSALNIIWDRPVDSSGIAGMVKDRSKALGIVLACGFLLVVSLAVSSVIAASGKLLSGMPIPEILLHALMSVLSVAILTGVFSVLFKYLPDVEVQWHDVFIGAAFTAVLFTIGKLLIGMYLGKASFGSTYGAAGSLVIVLVWVYYSAQIFFFGAEFTQVYAGEMGSDPTRKRQSTRSTAASKEVPATTPANDYTVSGAQGTNVDPASASAGALIGSGLILWRLARIFRRAR